MFKKNSVLGFACSKARDHRVTKKKYRGINHHGRKEAVDLKMYFYYEISRIHAFLDHFVKRTTTLDRDDLLECPTVH